MPSEKEIEIWTIDQITKSEFFHQKLYEWGLLEIAYELEKIKGEDLDWNRTKLGITERAWKMAIHRGIKPIIVFSHPEVFIENPKRVGYYRMLAMVSQKSMSRVSLSITRYEEGTGRLTDDSALSIAKHLNKIVSILIEHDEKIDAREFDIWRGMAAGSQAQGSWQNTKGDRAEIVIKDLIERRIRERKLSIEDISHGKGEVLKLRAGKQVILGNEPDIGVYKNDLIQIAVEIKGWY